MELFTVPLEVGGETAALITRLTDAGTAVERLVSRDDLAAFVPVVDGFVAAAVRLFAACAERGTPAALTANAVAPTEALTLVGALLSIHDINSFDLALWLSHSGPDARTASDPAPRRIDDH